MSTELRILLPPFPPRNLWDFLSTACNKIETPAVYTRHIKSVKGVDVGAARLHRSVDHQLPSGDFAMNWDQAYRYAFIPKYNQARMLKLMSCPALGIQPLNHPHLAKRQRRPNSQVQQHFRHQGILIRVLKIEVDGHLHLRRSIPCSMLHQAV